MSRRFLHLPADCRINRSDAKDHPLLCFDNKAEEAANFYISIFKNSMSLTITSLPDQSLRSHSTRDKILLMTIDVEKTIPPEWLAEFEAAARRPLALRMKYSFIQTYKPVLDDAKFRAFDTTAQYRKWCEENLPDWLGYGRI